MMLPCSSPSADPGLAIGSPMANFLKLVSLELGRGLLVDEPKAEPPPRPVNPSRLDCLMLAKTLNEKLCSSTSRIHKKSEGGSVINYS
jgi:hypothetical protein